MQKLLIAAMLVIAAFSSGALVGHAGTTEPALRRLESLPEGTVTMRYSRKIGADSRWIVNCHVVIALDGAAGPAPYGTGGTCEMAAAEALKALAGK